MTRQAEDNRIQLRRTPEGFRFASDFDRELGERWGIGALVQADIHQARSSKHQRWYRALVRAVWRHQDHYASADALHKALKYHLGEYDLIYTRAGEAIIDFRSTAYTSMDEGEFREHVNRTWDIISQRIIPGLDEHGREQLTAEIDRLLQGSRR